MNPTACFGTVIGHHRRDDLLSRWDEFKDKPWGTLARSTQVRGIESMEGGVERCRARVTPATGIPPEVCTLINLGYRDPVTTNVEDFADREDGGVLLVRRAGGMLDHLREQPAWAGGNLPR